MMLQMLKKKKKEGQTAGCMGGTVRQQNLGAKQKRVDKKSSTNLYSQFCQEKG